MLNQAVDRGTTNCVASSFGGGFIFVGQAESELAVESRQGCSATFPLSVCVASSRVIQLIHVHD